MAGLRFTQNYLEASQVPEEESVEERGLARPARAHDGQQLAWPHQPAN
jgi:hypothetical protein